MLRMCASSARSSRRPSNSHRCAPKTTSSRRKFAAAKYMQPCRHRQVDELQRKAFDESKRGDRAEFQAQDASKQMADLLQEKEACDTPNGRQPTMRIAAETPPRARRAEAGARRHSLWQHDQHVGVVRAHICCAPQQRHGRLLNVEASALQDKIRSLEDEVAALRASTSGTADDRVRRAAARACRSYQQVHQVTALLESANAFKDKLAAENRAQSIRILELESDAKCGCVVSKSTFKRCRKPKVQSTDEMIVQQLATCERELRATRERLVRCCGCGFRTHPVLQSGAEAREKESAALVEQLQSQLAAAQQESIQFRKELRRVSHEYRTAPEHATQSDKPG